MERIGCDDEIVKKAEIQEALEIHAFLERIRENTGNALRERKTAEITQNINWFVIIRDGEKIIACGEVFQTENTFTLELWALATDPGYREQWWSDKIIEYSEAFAKRERKYLMLVTHNGLGKKLLERGYQLSPIRYAGRQAISPKKSVYVRY